MEGLEILLSEISYAEAKIKMERMDKRDSERRRTTELKNNLERLIYILPRSWMNLWSLKSNVLGSADGGRITIDFSSSLIYLASYGDMSDDIFGVRGIVGVPRWWSSPAAMEERSSRVTPRENFVT